MENQDAVIRRATDADAPAVAEVWLRSFATALPTVRRAHTDDQVRDWIRHVVVPGQETWVATVDDSVVAMMVLDGDELDQLYLDPPWQGRGIGSGLLATAKQLRPSGLTLWTFQVNAPARRFYTRHGFVPGARTDGRRNEEREPDIQYVWRPGEQRD